MIIPRVKSEKRLGFAHKLPKILSVFTCDAPAEKAFEVLKIFLPTVVFVKATTKNDAHIVFECRPSVTTAPEKYVIHAEALPIVVHYRAFLGARNATASLAQLLTKTDDGYTIDATVIDDEPDSEIRMMMLDPVRTLIPVNQLKDTLIRLALAKYNLVHLHLSDTQGLAFRSDYFPQIPGPHGLQYSKAELRALIEFGEQLGLEFMPEVEFPGHGRQVTEALPELKCTTINGEPGNWAMCAGAEATYAYLETIYTELAELFPHSRFIHVGTDEIAMYDIKTEDVFPNWDDCAVCKAMCAREGIDNHNLIEIFYYMLRRVYRIVSKLGKRMVMWNDYIDISKSPALPRDILIHFWRIAGEDRGPREGCTMQRFLEEGFECLNSYYPETYICRDYYPNNDDTVRVWTPKSLPIPDCPLLLGQPSSAPVTDPQFASQILGGGPCAWGEKTGLSHYMWSLPSAILLYGDRLWNFRICDDPDAFGKSATRWALGIDAPSDFDVYKSLGGFTQPRSVDGTRAWVHKAAENLDETEAVLRKLVKSHTVYGKLAAEYVKSIEWLKNERRKQCE